jgi:hypothetical protein
MLGRQSSIILTPGCTRSVEVAITVTPLICLMSAEAVAAAVACARAVEAELRTPHAHCD